MTDTPTNLPARYSNGRFGPGNPGRPVGAYNRASKRAVLSILDHFEAHKDRLLDGMLVSDFDRALYVKLLSRVLPRELSVTVSEPPPMSDAEVAAVYADARLLLDGNCDRRAALAELGGLLLGAESEAEEIAVR
ncbi:MAG TPA: hypothetical protein VGH15_06785 [Caulobacteraceae bacterium]